ncbi:MAG TPA: PAS domain S-box protein [Candidatus Thermoplasmatota archaeon]|nr:PAS domain S-box protein [Candidatus Thermoplasmatota archaeon]
MRAAKDRLAELVNLEDDEVVQALAHASRERDPMLANVLATEALNRMRRARTAFNHLGEGLIAIDPDGRITSVNPTACTLLRASRAALLGQSFHDAVLPVHEDGTPIGPDDCAIMSALRGGVVIETESENYTRHDGERFPVSIIAAPIREEGEVHGAVATFLDISGRREAEARRAATIDASLDAIITIDGEGVVREFNAAAERIFGYTRHQAIGQRLADLIVPPESREAHLGGVHRVALGGPSHILGKRVELEALRADGSRFPVELAITRLPGLPVQFTGFVRDLTEEHMARAQARAAAARWEQMVSRSPLSTQIFAPDGATVATNASWEHLWGVTLEQLGGYNVLKDPLLETKGVTPFLRRAFAGETVYIPPVLYDPREVGNPLGRARWVEAHAYPLLDDAGAVDAVVLVHDDVTARIEAGQRTALTQSQAQLLIESIDDIAICMLDPEGRVVSWNKGSARMNGYEADEVVGQHVRIFHPPEAQASGDPERGLADAARDGVSHADGWLVRKGGERYWASTTLTAIRPNGELIGFAKVVRDLTRPRAAEDRLREQERMYRELVENSPEPMGVHAGGKLLFINAAGARLLGAGSTQELIGRNVIGFVAPESRALVAQRLRSMQESGEPLPPAEETLLRVDGSLVHVETVALPIRYEGQAAVQLILRDISHRKHAEASLRRSSAQLEQRVHERTRELQEALRDLETFTNSASHDLRAPLRGTALVAEELEAAIARGDLAEAKQLARLVRTENAKAARLVHDLLAFAKSGHHEVSPARVDVTRLVREVAADLAAQHPERRTTWDIQEGMVASADPALLRIALHNLLANGAKYSATAPAPTVVVRAAKDADGVTLRVSDNGVGFPPQEAYRLFGPFQRLSTAQGFEGTGLGLVTVHRIAQRHGGRVTAQSPSAPGAGGGATFELWLPGRPEARTHAG